MLQGLKTVFNDLRCLPLLLSLTTGHSSHLSLSWEHKLELCAIPGESDPVYPGLLFCSQEALSQIRVNHLALVNKSGVLPLMRYLYTREWETPYSWSYFTAAGSTLIPMFPANVGNKLYKPSLMPRSRGRRYSFSLLMWPRSYKSYLLSPAVGCGFVRAEQLSKWENDKCFPKVSMVLDHTGVVPNNHGNTKLSQVSGDC